MRACLEGVCDSIILNWSLQASKACRLGLGEESQTLESVTTNGTRVQGRTQQGWTNIESDNHKISQEELLKTPCCSLLISVLEFCETDDCFLLRENPFIWFYFYLFPQLLNYLWPIFFKQFCGWLLWIRLNEHNQKWLQDHLDLTLVVQWSAQIQR